MLIYGAFEGAGVEIGHSSVRCYNLGHLGILRFVLRTIFQGIHQLRDEVARGKPEALEACRLITLCRRKIRIDPKSTTLNLEALKTL